MEALLVLSSIAPNTWQAYVSALRGVARDLNTLDEASAASHGWVRISSEVVEERDGMELSKRMAHGLTQKAFILWLVFAGSGGLVDSFLRKYVLNALN